MTDLDLLALDRIGFIPGPAETEEEFLARVARTKAQHEKGEWIPDSHWDWVRAFLDELFHVKPLYICALYSDRSLAPWQAAAAWGGDQKLGYVQLRKRFGKGKFLGYVREEILAHEAVHIIRSGFEESKLEEFFAYMTSEKKWRRVLGPIVQRPWEVWPFLLCAVLGPFFSFFYLGASLWAGIGFFRLINGHLQLNRAATQILKKTKDVRTTRAILFRLTDREISLLAKGRDLFAEGQTCLRWRVIQHYLKEGIWRKKSL